MKSAVVYNDIYTLWLKVFLWNLWKKVNQSNELTVQIQNECVTYFIIGGLQHDWFTIPVSSH